MDIFLAGMKRAYLPELEANSKVLVSFASHSEKAFLQNMDIEERNVILDSGAFSVWSKGASIEIQDYIDFVRAHPGLEGCIALDVIGGNAEAQLQNLAVMREAKLQTPIWPVFHEGDDMELLKQYIKDGYERICLAGTKSRGRACLQDWVWSVLDAAPPQKQCHTTAWP